MTNNSIETLNKIIFMDNSNHKITSTRPQNDINHMKSSKQYNNHNHQYEQ